MTLMKDNSATGRMAFRVGQPDPGCTWNKLVSASSSVAELEGKPKFSSDGPNGLQITETQVKKTARRRTTTVASVETTREGLVCAMSDAKTRKSS